MHISPKRTKRKIHSTKRSPNKRMPKDEAKRKETKKKRRRKRRARVWNTFATLHANEIDLTWPRGLATKLRLLATKKDY